MNLDETDSNFFESTEYYVDCANEFNTSNRDALPEKKIHSDIKPFKDVEKQKGYITKISHHLLETNYANELSSIRRNIRSLNSGNFQAMVRHLLKRTVPDIQLSRNFSEELPKALKTLQCPVADAITPKELLSVGAPHSYPNFLAVLSWLTDLSKMFQVAVSYQNPRYNEGFLFQKDYINWIFSTYAINAHEEYLRGDKDMTEATNDVKICLDRTYDAATLIINEYSKGLEAINTEIKRVKKDYPTLDYVKKHQADLLSDIEKFKIYCGNKQVRIEKRKELGRQSERHIEDCEIKEREIKAKIEEIKQELANRGLTKDMIDNEIAKERKLATEANRIQKKADELKKVYDEKRGKYEKLLKQADGLVKDYNKFLSKHAGTLPDGINENQLRIDFDPANGYTTEIFPADFEARIVPVLNNLHKQCKDELVNVVDSNLRLRTEISELTEDISSIETDIDIWKRNLERKKNELDERHMLWRTENERSLQELEDYKNELEKKERDAFSSFHDLQKKVRESTTKLEVIKRDSEIRRREKLDMYTRFVDDLWRGLKDIEELGSETFDYVKKDSETISQTIEKI
ncbi:unnamed protein product [Rhizopus stolonifer]